MGKISADFDYNVIQGIEYLKGYLEDKKSPNNNAYYSTSDANLLIAKCFYLKSNKIKAKEFLQRSLKESSTNGDAIEWGNKVHLLK